ncbi:spore germination protein [Bacillus horti]|uniref:Spore germination protein n=1 Tax=Caldalkalibacillus horti TaxID=77523 RepID=A0ABT9W0V0_9BACI|nr:spore germination protein [Bacillus horti]MDQ0166682.1 hypothetical protein [Bacillus horti]
MLFYTHLNQIFNIEVINASSNGSVNVGNVIGKGFSSSSKSVGSQSIIGNALVRPATNGNFNLVFDPDFIDQPQKQL